MKKNADFFPTHIKKRKMVIISRYHLNSLINDIQIKTSLEGEHNIKNILASFAVYYCLGKKTNNFAFRIRIKRYKGHKANKI